MHYYTTKLNPATIEAISAYKHYTDVYNQSANDKEAIIKANTCPSGRMRKGGKAHIEIAEEVLQANKKHYLDAKSKLSMNLRLDINQTKQTCVHNVLTNLMSCGRSDVTRSLARAARDSLGSKLIQTMYVCSPAYKFEICLTIEADGVVLNVSPLGEGRGVCGGAINVRRKGDMIYDYSNQVKITESMDVKLNEENGEIHIQLPDCSCDGDYGITLMSRNHMDGNYARAFFFLVDACVDIANEFNGMLAIHALSLAKYKICD